MQPYSVELIAAGECEMRELKAATIGEIIRSATVERCPATAGQAARITISLECWRDSAGKLHCKLSVSFSAA